MPYNIFAADQQYGQWLKKNDRRVFRGYIKWAKPLTKWINDRGPESTLAKWTHKIVTPWSEHMAYLMGATRADNELGRLLMKLGRPLCSLVSYLPLRSKTAKAATTITVCALCVGNYYIARSVISLKKIKSYTFKELRNER